MDSFFNTVSSSDPQLRDAYMAVGLCVSMWSKVEENLSGLFQRVSGIPYWGTSFELFFSASGTGQRISLIEASLRFPHCSDFWKDQAHTLVKLVSKEVRVRNKIVHGFHLAFADTYGAVIANHRDIMNSTAGYNVDQLNNWAVYIEKLNRILFLFSIEFDQGGEAQFSADLREFLSLDRPDV